MVYEARLHVEPFRELCNARRWTVGDFARQAGVGDSTVYRVLSGETPPSAGFIAACAVLFGVESIPRLFQFTRAPFAPVLSRRDRGGTAA